MKSRIFFKLLASFFLVIAAATVIFDFTIRHYWESSLEEEITRELTQKTQLFALRVQNDKSNTLAQIVTQEAEAAGARATVIDSTGRVLADSQAVAEKMENHATRPEFVAALAGKLGNNIRVSRTLGINFLYSAAPIPHGAVRLAYPLASLNQTLAQTRWHILDASVLALLIALLLAAALAQNIARRLQRIVRFAERVAAGDLTARMEDPAYDEISQVAAALDRTAHKLEENFTALESSRRQLETLLNGIQDAVIAVSADGKVQWANGTLQRLQGKAAHVGAPLVETIRDPDLLHTLEETLTLREVRHTRSANVAPGRIFDATIAPMPEGGAVCVLHDLTDLERVEKTRRDFIANVSHELRTPLTSVQGYAETLLETLPPGDSTSQGFVEIIRKNANRMARLTDDLLTLARVESGEQKMDIQPVPAFDLLQDAMQSFGELVRLHSMELKMDSAPAQRVAADRDAIHQVFGNLIENASKYAAATGHIEIGARALSEVVEFYVQDFGPGIASEHLPRLFERFYRVDKARSSETGGTGLGLSIVKHIILNHRGAVRVESQLHHGSKFFFTLPLAAYEADYASEISIASLQDKL